MGKSLEISDMPPLTRAAHEELRGLEHRLQVALSSCCGSYSLNDPTTAVEYLRTYATEFYDCFYNFYSQFPDPRYRPHWRPASEKFAFQRTVQGIQNIYAIRDYFNADTTRVARIKRTISDYADRITPPPPGIEKAFPALTGKQAAAYSAAGINLASASPLLLMVHEAAQIPPPPLPPEVQAQVEAPTTRLADTRRAYVLPLLEEKGWSILEWATEAEVAYHTTADFLAGKTNPYRSSRLKMARALGVTVQQLPR